MHKKFIILACIGGLILGMPLLYFSRVSSEREIIILLPDASEIKVKPRDPGGLVIPHSDSLVYEKLNVGRAKSAQVHILPDPEEPVKIVRNVEHEAKFLDSIDEILANLGYYENELLDNNPSEEDNLDYIMPNKLSGKEDLLASDEAIIFLPGTKLKVMKALEDRYKTMRINVVSDKDKGYKIQLSSASSVSGAKKEWQKIQQKYSKILQNANLIIKKVDGSNERIFYLVMAGSYPSLNHAKMVCKKLSFRQQNCIVTK
ncbi:MAG: SPOR domain-containing protein [Rickettsiaceae bacterium]|nr:SPOR domain-containing protein [Rickettsiaceae bacterium]